MFVFDNGGLTLPKSIINFPTKKHWKSRSRLADIAKGLQDLERVIRDLGIESVAVPPLGCGNGGLSWADVRPLIECALGDIDGVDVLMYAPEGAPAESSMRVATDRPKMSERATRGRNAV